jgi:hypothetical protein
VIATRFNGGILLACDPFTFDNDRESPQKSVQFHKIFVAEKQNLVSLGVGSRWVFRSFNIWLEKQQPQKYQHLQKISSKWSELQNEWLEKRKEMLEQYSANTLRPASNSLLILVSPKDIKTITAIDTHGNVRNSSSFVICGSGSDLVAKFLKNSNKLFAPSNKLDETFKLAFDCFDVASDDLYVIGIPSIMIVYNDQVIDFSNQCEIIWKKTKTKYANELKKAIRKQHT